MSEADFEALLRRVEELEGQVVLLESALDKIADFFDLTNKVLSSLVERA